LLSAQILPGGVQRPAAFLKADRSTPQTSGRSARTRYRGEVGSVWIFRSPGRIAL